MSPFSDVIAYVAPVPGAEAARDAAREALTGAGARVAPRVSARVTHVVVPRPPPGRRSEADDVLRQLGVEQVCGGGGVRRGDSACVRARARAISVEIFDPLRRLTPSLSPFLHLSHRPRS